MMFLIRAPLCRNCAMLWEHWMVCTCKLQGSLKWFSSTRTMPWKPTRNTTSATLMVSLCTANSSQRHVPGSPLESLTDTGMCICGDHVIIDSEACGRDWVWESRTQCEVVIMSAFIIWKVYTVSALLVARANTHFLSAKRAVKSGELCSKSLLF